MKKVKLTRSYPINSRRYKPFEDHHSENHMNQPSKNNRRMLVADNPSSEVLNPRVGSFNNPAIPVTFGFGNFLPSSANDGITSKFQWKVLLATSKIPFGETRSYQWVARSIHCPKAVRAVGQALKKNPFPIIIPCHRVIRSDGCLGGYAGGLGKKRKLLKYEKEIADSLRFCCGDQNKKRKDTQ